MGQKIKVRKGEWIPRLWWAVAMTPRLFESRLKGAKREVYRPNKRKFYRQYAKGKCLCYTGFFAKFSALISVLRQNLRLGCCSQGWPNNRCMLPGVRGSNISVASHHADTSEETQRCSHLVASSTVHYISRLKVRSSTLQVKE